MLRVLGDGIDQHGYQCRVLTRHAEVLLQMQTAIESLKDGVQDRQARLLGVCGHAVCVCVGIASRLPHP